MIIFRYLTKEVLLTTLVITILLVLIFLSNQFVRYLTQIAAGKMALSILVQLVIFEVPFLFGYLFPVGLFFGTLLAYGRMYADNEITILRACGFSEARLLCYTLAFSLVIVAIVATLVLWVAPAMMRYQANAMAIQAEDLLLETITPGRFQTLQDGRQVFYVESTTNNHSGFHNLFVAQWQKPSKKNATPTWLITSANNAKQITNKDGEHLIVANNGYRYNGVPGRADYAIIKYDSFQMRLPQKKIAPDFRTRAMTLSELNSLRLNASSHLALPAEAEWQWRISMTAYSFLLVLVAVPLSRVKPRQGKFAKILPAALIFIIYANLLFIGRGWVENNTLPKSMGLLAIHLPFLLLGLFLLLPENSLLKAKRRLTRTVKA